MLACDPTDFASRIDDAAVRWHMIERDELHGVVDHRFESMNIEFTTPCVGNNIDGNSLLVSHVEICNPVRHVFRRRGEDPVEVEIYDSAKRLVIDREATDKAIDYMKRKAEGDKPFFVFIPYTQTHMPVEPEPAWKGKTGNGHWADVLAQTDHYVGELLDTVDELGIRDNTLFIFTADNGPEPLAPHPTHTNRRISRRRHPHLGLAAHPCRDR